MVLQMPGLGGFGQQNMGGLLSKGGGKGQPAWGGKGSFESNNDQTVEWKLDEWVRAKRARDFTTSDAIQLELEAQGIDCHAARPDPKKRGAWGGGGGKGGGAGPHSPAIEARLDEWVQAKRSKDYTTSDSIQSELEAQGIDCYVARPSEAKKWDNRGKGSGSSSGGAAFMKGLADGGPDKMMAAMFMMAMLKGGGKGGGSQGGGSQNWTNDWKQPGGTYKVDKSGGELGDYIGVIKSFNENKNFGFIVSEDLTKLGYGDVFLHGDVKKGYQRGQTVKFNCVINKDGKPNAIDLRSGVK